MDRYWKQVIWGQLGATLDSFERVIRACPEPLWKKHGKRPGLWYPIFHALFFMDCYLADAAREFQPPAPFGMTELDPSGLMPERVYTKAELRAYLAHCGRRAREVIRSMTTARGRRPRRYSWVKLTEGEFLLYITRHNQHHVGQLQVILRDETGEAPRWVRRARTPLERR